MPKNLTFDINFLSMHGLRERKKAATRQAISDVATRLFEARGFEAVTVAEIAAAANVAVKTVFNYFGSKEDLFFDAEDAVLERLLAAVRAGEGLRELVLDGPLLAGTECRWRDLDGALYEGMRVWLETERASPTLSARRLVIMQSWVAPLTEASGSPAWAAMFTGILTLRHQTLTQALLEQRTPRTVQRRVRTTIGDALDALDRAFPNLNPT